MKKRAALALAQVIVVLVAVGPYVQIPGWVILPLAVVAILLLQHPKAEEEWVSGGPRRLAFSEKIQKKLPWTER